MSYFNLTILLLNRSLITEDRDCFSLLTACHQRLRSAAWRTVTLTGPLVCFEIWPDQPLVPHHTATTRRPQRATVRCTTQHRKNTRRGKSRYTVHRSRRCVTTRCSTEDL